MDHACLTGAIYANNGGGYNSNPTLPSSPDAVAPAYGPSVSLYSQRVGQVPFESNYERTVPLSEPQGDFTLLPPSVYVELSRRNCMAAHGLGPK
jgi:hypothetical protein